MAGTNRVPLDATLMPFAAAAGEAIDNQQTQLAAVRTLFNCPFFFHSHSRVRMLRARLRCSGGSVTERGGGREGGREVVHPVCPAAPTRRRRNITTAERF